MKTLAHYFPDARTNLHPREDYHLASGNSFCVADGITRDPLKISDFAGHSMEDLLASYPNPSPASKAAQVACEAFCAHASSQGAERALLSANQAVERLNRDLKADYLTNDFAACVAAGGVVKENLLQWVSIGDCFVVIFRSGKKIFESPNGVAEWAKYEKEHPDNWAKPEYRKKVRSQFRNNPDQIVNGVCISYGALTGEEKAKFFIFHGEQKLKQGDLILGYSDGFSNLVNHPDFIANLQAEEKKLKNWVGALEREDPSRFGHEKTLIVVGALV